jgi:hypothetical protein
MALLFTIFQMDLSAHIRKKALAIPGKQQLIMLAFAKALEIIPRQICDNAGLDSTDVLNKLRMRHARGNTWSGVDVDGAEGVRDNMEAFVWEPALVKLNAIQSAAEAACLILSVDETVRNPQSEQVRVSTAVYHHHIHVRIHMLTGTILNYDSQILVQQHHRERPPAPSGDAVGVWLVGDRRYGQTRTVYNWTKDTAILPHIVQLIGALTRDWNSVSYHGFQNQR